MKSFKANFRAFVRAATGFFTRAFDVYTREAFFENTPKQVISLLQSAINDTNMVTTDAKHYMEMLFDAEEEDGVRYLVPCAEWVNYMGALQVGVGWFYQA